MTPEMIVTAKEERRPNAVRRTIAVDGREQTFFEITGPELPPPLEICDFAVIATVFRAMYETRPLHIEGPVSAALMRNLEEFQDVWTMWRPEIYQRISITSSEERDTVTVPKDRHGVFAYSGGVDSASALLRHRTGAMNRRTVTPRAAVLIHGFDIPLANERAFETARRSTEQALFSFDLPLCIVRTNWKESLCNRWEMEFGAGVAACMHQFTGMATIGVLGSSEDYARIVFPWGSNPITDGMMSGGAFTLQLECRGLTRTERVALISEYPEIASRLRVCWEGPMTGQNCGQCEKCIRTALNFLAAGKEPTCFERRLTPWQILGAKAVNAPQISLLEEIRDSAARRGKTEIWQYFLLLSILKNKILKPIRPLITRILGTLRRLLRTP